MRRALAFIIIPLAACSSRSTPDHMVAQASPPDLGPIVATVGEIPVYAKQVTSKAKVTGKSTRQALEEIVDTYLLAEVARRRGGAVDLADDVDVRSAMVQRFLEREAEPHLRPDTLSEDVLRAAYEKAIDHFVHPRVVEIAVLAVYTGARMKNEEREERERTAHDLAAFIRSHPPKSLEELQALVSDPQWKTKHITLRRLHQSADKPLSARVGAEVAKLRAPGETTPLVIDETGCFIARYVSEKPAENIAFAEARPTLVDKLYEKLRQQQFTAFVDKLMRAHRIEAHFERLSSNGQGP